MYGTYVFSGYNVSAGNKLVTVAAGKQSYTGMAPDVEGS